MTKSEFIQGLKQALAGAPDRLISENLQYYNSYIDTEIAKGRSEEDVFAELGDPRWIAKSILDAEAGNTWTGENAYDYGNGAYEYSDIGSGAYRTQETGQNTRIRTFDLSKWYVKALLIAIPVLIVILFFKLMGFAIKMVFGILFSPTFWSIAIALVIAGWFFKRR